MADKKSTEIVATCHWGRFAEAPRTAGRDNELQLLTLPTVRRFVGLLCD